MQSVIDGRVRPRCCYYCGSEYGLHEHHIFGGANRRLSEKYGLKVTLCWRDHNGDSGVHFDKDKMDELKKEGQRAFERAFMERRYREDGMFYSVTARERFLSIFGRNCL